MENRRLTKIKETVKKLKTDKEKIKYLDACAEDWNTNTKTKVFPDGSTNTTYCNSRFIFKDKEINEIYSSASRSVLIEEKARELDVSLELAELWLKAFEMEQQEKRELEKEKRKLRISAASNIPLKNVDRERDDILKRARDKCFDIARLNDWKYFITVTFKGSKFEFDDPEVVMKKIRSYLMHKVQRNGMKYLLIPERHKKGGIHCHALVNDIDVVDSGTVLVEGYPKPIKRETALKRGSTIKQTVYNIPSWKYGFSTAIEIDNSTAFAYYVTKYITKGNKKIFGKYYWSSRNCIREPQIIYHNSDFDHITRSEFCKGQNKYKYNSNNLIIPDFDKLADRFDDISSFLDYIYSDEYKKEYEKYEQTKLSNDFNF